MAEKGGDIYQEKFNMKKGFLWKNGSLPQTERWWILSAEHEHHVETGQYS